MVWRKKWVFAAFLTAGVTAAAAGIYTATAESPIDPDSPYSIDIPYEYPIQPGTSEWFGYPTPHDRAAVCQIPEDILGELTTPALVETIVNYPFLIEMSLFVTPEEGYAAVRYCFNGLSELECRPDGGVVLMDYYETCREERPDLCFLDYLAMEIILQQPEITVHMTPEQRERAAGMTQELSRHY
ncbi:hypothetical protein D1159_17640 [Pseudoflavonifractor sp. 524-17]|uniref:hypothetical protein n=1 Tax=Pseudoflavonifractor sp. 524-17 TaxID=2304577 RepID=UPI00137A4A0A|nr:hypothetical protein [Pseudoflavonifractor sp. 524-17]NCE66342.1 hypothetical protein [Pseudoflavonifractor sp. 524-17]